MLSLIHLPILSTASALESEGNGLKLEIINANSSPQLDKQAKGIPTARFITSFYLVKALYVCLFVLVDQKKNWPWFAET